MTNEELIKFRNEAKTKIKDAAKTYIDAILYESDYDKGKYHWDMIEHVCEYASGVPFEEDGTLYLYLHDKTQEITDQLDVKIGLVLNRSRGMSNRELGIYAGKLTTEIIRMVQQMIPDGTETISRKQFEIKPTKLIAPSKRGR